MTVIRWRRAIGSDRIDWLEYIPAEWLAQKGWRRNVTHLTYENGTIPKTCKCDVKVDAKQMILFYDGVHSSFNRANFEPGRSILSFAGGKSRSLKPDVIWRIPGWKA